MTVLELGAGESRSIDLAEAEAAVVPLSGSCRVETDGRLFDLEGREDVFSAVTDLCFVPKGSQVTITAPQGGRFCVATTVATRTTEPRYYPAAGVKVDLRGAGQATRQINNLLTADVPGPDRLLVVEVLTPAGNWSSYPPHKHDELTDAETPLEEIYYFEIDGPGGFGFHRTYTPDRQIDETVTVRSGDVFLVPRGYHGPCVAAPGYHMYYLNVMAGPQPGREWLICTDPAYQWLWEVWVDEPPDPRLPLY
jgi:5-deoxy-glucuronate isomerase